MKLKKVISKALAVFMIATSIPVFAASTNGIDKTIIVAKDSTIETTLAPELKIRLKDDLAKGQQFYLKLENAEWNSDIETKLGISSDFIFERESKTRLVVEAKRKLVASTTEYRIPLIAKITGEEAKVEIISNETVVTSGKYTFAKSEEIRSILTAGEVKVFATKGEMGEISIEEQYTRAFKSNKPQTIKVEIKTKGIEFDYSKGQTVYDVLKGTRAYLGKKYNAKIVSPTILEVEIPANSLNETQRGTLNLSGVRLKATKEAAYGDVKISVSGDLNEWEELIVARFGDYATDLKVIGDYEVIAGQELQDVEFTLGEVIPDSFDGRRETAFTFSEGIEIKDVAIVKSEGLQTGAPNPIVMVTKKDNKNTNNFKVASIVADASKKTSVTFKATLKIPATFKGNIMLEAEGRSLEDKKEVTIAKVNAPVEVKVTPITAKVGFAQQEGGKIVITETAKGNLLPGKIFLAFEDTRIQYTKAPKVKVLEGNIKVDPDAKIVPGGLEITINGKSREAATIEINGGEFKVETLVSEGTYKVSVGGTAISVHSSSVLWNTVKDEYNEIDAITEQDFIYVGSNPTSNRAEFVIGKTTYSVDGSHKTMDTAAYLAKEGRTMLPVRYVADALGIPANQIIWDSENKAVIIIANENKEPDKIIRIELDNKEMIINNVKVQMTAAAEIKDNRVFIPVAEIARALGAYVQWDSVTQTATFN